MADEQIRKGDWIVATQGSKFREECEMRGYAYGDTEGLRMELNVWSPTLEYLRENGFEIRKEERLTS